MANFLTYLDWRGDLLFSRDPVNDDIRRISSVAQCLDASLFQQTFMFEIFLGIIYGIDL